MIRAIMLRRARGRSEVPAIPPVRFRTYLGLLVVAVLIPVVGFAAYLSLLSAEAERTSLEHGM
jgi:hypothetical protein